MPTRVYRTSERTINEENIYLSKVLILTQNAQEIAEGLKDLSESAISINCINTIGMFPIISRFETPLGKLCLSIWVIRIDPRFEQFRTAYFAGAAHTILINSSDEEYSNFSQLLQISPQGIPITVVNLKKPYKAFDTNNLSESGNQNPHLSHRLQLVKYITIDNSYFNLKNIFSDIAQKIAQDILSGEYQTFSPDFKQHSSHIRFDQKAFLKIQEMIGKIGYTLHNNGKVTIFKKDFIYEIDFFKSQVTATIAYCANCEKNCKHIRKLCVVEESQGFSNEIMGDNLRALAILYAIHDGTFFSLAGTKTHEDIQYQLQKLKSLYENNCDFVKEEKRFLQSTTKVKRRKSTIT